MARRAIGWICCWAALFFALLAPVCAAADPPAASRALVYETDFTRPPYRYTKNGHYKGFEVALNTLLFAGSGFHPAYRDSSWTLDELPDAVRSSDAACFGHMPLLDEVTSVLSVTDPIYTYRLGAFARAPLPGATLADLGDVPVGITQKENLSDLREHLNGHENVRVYASPVSAARDLIDGVIDVWLEEKSVGEFALISISASADAVYVEELETRVSAVIALRGGNDELIAHLNRRIAQVKESGELETLHTQHFKTHSAEYLEGQARRNQNLTIASVSIGAVALVVMLLVLNSRARVRRLNEQLSEMLEALQESYARYELAVDGTNDGVFYYDTHSDKLFLSDQFRAILPIGAVQATDLRSIVEGLILLISPEDRGAMRALLEHIEHAQRYTGQVEVRLAAIPRWIQFKMTIAPGGDGHLRIGGSVSDVTARRVGEEKIRYFADYDALTGIYNRRKFMESMRPLLDELRGAGRSLALFYLDLDNFKRVNDELGHHTGDDLLRDIAARISAVISEGTIFARIGGDEFTVALPCGSNDEAVELARRIIAALNAIEYGGIAVGVSIGLVLFPEDGTALDELIRKADTASQLTKRTGKNSVTRWKAGMKIPVDHRTR